MPEDSIQDNIINFLIELNRSRSQEFRDPDQALARRLYREVHPTEIAALKCMDGRLNLPWITQTPMGIINPFRNIGGRFNMGWPFFGNLLRGWVGYAIDKQRESIILVTYHFSIGDDRRGCAGFGYDTDAARGSSQSLVYQIERVFGARHTVVYPILVGIETDFDTLVFHGSGGQVLNMFDSCDLTEAELVDAVHQLYPDMKERMVLDLLPLMIGNQRHIKQLVASPKHLNDREHREQILAIGRGFDWLHLPNRALIVGPYSLDLTGPIATAAKILHSNLTEGRVPQDVGIALMSSAAYRGGDDDAEVERLIAVEKAQEMAKFALEVIRNQVPLLRPFLHILVGVVNQDNRLLERIPFAEREIL